MDSSNYVLSSLALIIELDLPAPLASVFRLPSLDQHAYFTLWQQHQLANILSGRPAILTRHLIPRRVKIAIVGCNACLLAIVGYC
jgi:hypothetical protein